MKLVHLCTSLGHSDFFFYLEIHEIPEAHIEGTRMLFPFAEADRFGD